MPDFSISRASISTYVKSYDSEMMTTTIHSFILVPKRTGIFEVGATGTWMGKIGNRKSTAQVEVTAGSNRKSKTSYKTKHSINHNNGVIFIKTSVNNKAPYAGEQITFTLEHYDNIYNTETKYKHPSRSGLWSVELPEISGELINLEGEKFWRDIYRTAFFPTFSGELDIGSAQLYYLSKKGTFSQWGNLFSEPISITAKPLPEKGKPAEFSGSVGNFTLSSSVDTTTVKAGEVLTIHVTVTGKGNLDIVSSVDEPDLSAFKIFDIKVKKRVTYSGFIVGGSKTWDYVVIPRIEGIIKIQSFSLSFFNPYNNGYQTVATKPIELNILPNNDLAYEESELNNLQKIPLQRIASDIRYIKPDKKKLINIKKHIYETVYFHLLYILPLIVFVMCFAVKKHHNTIESSPGLKRNLNAWKNAQKRFDKLCELFAAGKSSDFYLKLREIIILYIDDILNIDTLTMTATELEEVVKEHGISPGLAGHLRKSLEAIDCIRFASAVTNHEMNEKIFEDTRDLLSALRSEFSRENF